MRTPHVTVIGAGAGGLAAAIDLARSGVAVTLLERASTVGGKIRQLQVGGAGIDAGPTVLTMRWVFDALFDDAGVSLADHLTLHPIDLLARHAWSDTERLDLFADVDRSADAVAAFAGPDEAAGYRSFCLRAQRVYNTLEGPFIRAARPTALSLAAESGLSAMRGISPFSSHVEGFRRTFSRSAAAPVVWPLRDLQRILAIPGTGNADADRACRTAGRLAGRRRHGATGAGIIPTGGAIGSGCPGRRAGCGHHRQCRTGDRRCSGQRRTSRVGCSDMQCGLRRAGDRSARAGGDESVPRTKRDERSLSAITWVLSAATEGFPLSRHNVFFSRDYQAEFDDVFRHGRLPTAPTVYVCAQDRGQPGAQPDGLAERLLVLVNAPPSGDRRAFNTMEIEQCATRTFDLLQRCGLTVHRRTEATAVTTPAEFERLFPATGGALYGQAVHGSMAAFRRPGARSALAGLYLAGGSVHPGPGVPMAVLSGRLAAASVLQDLTSR